MIENILYYMVVTFSLTYLKVQLDVDTSTILTLMLISHIVHAAMILVFGWMSDKVGAAPSTSPARLWPRCTASWHSR